MISFAKLLCAFLTCLVEQWISPGFPYKFNVVYVQREKSQYLLYYTNIWSTHIQKQKQKKIIKRHFCLSFCLLHLLIPSCKFVMIETRAYNIAHGKNAMSSLTIQSILRSGRKQSPVFLISLQYSEESTCVGVSF